MTTACRRCLIAAGCVTLVGFFVLVRWALDQPLDGNVKSAPRVFEQEIASGMSIRYRHLHAESVSFKSCQMRRRRMGAFVLGGFRVLELEDVLLNLPLPAEVGAVTPTTVTPTTEMKPMKKPVNGAKALSATARQENPLDKVLEKVGLSGIGRFSGVAIRGIRVGRMTDTGAEPLFSAVKAETRGSTLQLSRCEVFRDGKRELVPEARLEWKNGLRIVWPDGSLDLPDLVEAKR